jgi:hypothetical protein
MRGRLLSIIALLFVTVPASAHQADDSSASEVSLSGVITGEDHQSYVSVPFRVPPNVREIIIDFQYDRTEGTVIDIGLTENGIVRGWSGGNKSRFIVGQQRATPSYLPGPVADRQLDLLLGIPNARPDANTKWGAKVSFVQENESAPSVSLNTTPGWYRGDFHTHSAHSDGGCSNTIDLKVPCPLYRTVEAAARAGMDFLAVTDHNTVSQLSEMEALQPAFPDLLLIPGQEVTTFQGHANVIGPTELAEFRVGSPAVPDGAAWSAAVGALGGAVSINHPGLPSGEICMGCGWTMQNVDWEQIDAVEVFNGGAVAAAGGLVESPISGIAFWESKLSEGLRLAPIAGSDNHDAGLVSPDPRAIGRMVTVVWADELSARGIVAALERGRVFIDLESDPERRLDLVAEGPRGEVGMGDKVSVKSGSSIAFKLKLVGCVSCTAELVANGQFLTRKIAKYNNEEFDFELKSITSRVWARPQARKASGELLLLGNAIIIEIVP